MQEKVFEIIKENGQTTPKEILSKTGLGPAMVHRHLKKLVETKRIIKIGSSPKVFYKLADQEEKKGNSSNFENKIVEENFSLITATGQEMNGMSGFVNWCQDRKLSVEDMIKKYEEQISQYKKFFIHGYIDASQKINSTFGKDSFLDELYYLDFYSYPVFGRTKISNWLFYGKTLQQKELMDRVIQEVRTKIYNFILDEKIDAVLFVPPTVPRKIQFMKVLEESLNLNIPKVGIVKAKTPIIIQQKSLRDLSDRVKNADTTLVVQSRDTSFKKLLLIDDFTGSGATLNVIAKKCKMQNVAQSVVGLTITGSINGFEVVKEI